MKNTNNARGENNEKGNRVIAYSSCSGCDRLRTGSTNIDSGGLVSPDQRVVQASLVDDEIWGVLKDFNDPNFSSIVCYQMTDQLKELNTDTPYEVISDEPLQLGVETAIAGNENLISFQDDSLFLAYILPSSQDRMI